MAPGPEHPTVKHFYEQRGHNSPRHIVGFVGASGDRRSTGRYSWRPPPDQGRQQFWRGSVGLKAVAVVAGLGHMGIHRNVIHPGFGNFSLLGTVLVDAEVSEYSHPIVYNPCLECNAVRRCLSDGATGPASSISLPCYAHNHREFMGGFSDWVEQMPTAAVPTNTGRSLTLGDGFHVARSVVLPPTTRRRTAWRFALKART
jgi:hypothetical protein